MEIAHLVVQEKLSFCSKELDGVDDQLVQWGCYALDYTKPKIGKP